MRSSLPADFFCACRPAKVMAARNRWAQLVMIVRDEGGILNWAKEMGTAMASYGALEWMCEGLCG
jgi:hypothetical protein